MTKNVKLTQKQPDVKKTQPVNQGQFKIAPNQETPSGENDETLIKNLMEDNFKYINEKNYNALYDLRSESVKQSLSPLIYEERYANNIGIRIEKTEIEEIEKNDARVIVDYASTDRSGGVDRNTVGAIRFYLIKENDKWVINDTEEIK